MGNSIIFSVTMKATPFICSTKQCGVYLALDGIVDKNFVVAIILHPHSQKHKERTYTTYCRVLEERVVHKQKSCQKHKQTDGVVFKIGKSEIKSFKILLSKMHISSQLSLFFSMFEENTKFQSCEKYKFLDYVSQQYLLHQSCCINSKEIISRKFIPFTIYPQHKTLRRLHIKICNMFALVRVFDRNHFGIIELNTHIYIQALSYYSKQNLHCSFQCFPIMLPILYT